MIEQGTDGILRGDLSTGVMSGKNMLEFIPLNKGMDSRSPELVLWFGEAAGGDWTTLDPRGLFHNVHLEDGNNIWCPPPTVADAALE